MQVGRGDGEFLVDLVHESPHRHAHRDVVFAVLLLDAHAERDLAVAARIASRVGQSVLDRGHVAQVDVGVINPLAAAGA